jgi:hypothetical protein
MATRVIRDRRSAFTVHSVHVGNYSSALIERKALGGRITTRTNSCISSVLDFMRLKGGNFVLYLSKDAG